MTTSTVLLLILSAVVAFILSFFQYIFKAKKRTKVFFFLAFLRFITYMVIFLLLINPVITTKSFNTVKTPLPVLIDNSLSVKDLGQDSLSRSIAGKISGNSALNQKYDVQLFTFDEDFISGKEPNFKGKQTHIDNAAQNLNQLFRNLNYPVVLLTDGNQTMGNDYVYSFKENTSVYPVVLGDTTIFTDLKINQVNVNKYALLKNKFPVEVFLQYSGTKPVDAEFTIMQGNTSVHKQKVSFSPDKKAVSVSLLLNADKVGVHTYKAVIASGVEEKNKYNNVKNFAIEVIDQRSEIALVSSVNHPDLGALKRAIETNKQRRVTIVKPEDITSLQDYNMLILYQPQASFRSLLEQNKNAKLNTFVITGLHTDFNILNQFQNHVTFKVSTQSEDYLADYKPQFNLFSAEDIGFNYFPPLQHPFGTITVNSNNSELLGARIRNVATENPLMAFFETGPYRNAYLFGENIWKWRVESRLNTNSFEQFDIFIDKTIQFLASNSKRQQLIVNHESFYNSGESISINAQYFNKNYEFDENAALTITVKNETGNSSKTYDFLKGYNEYKINFDGLDAGKYTFTVKEKNSNTAYSGSFEVIDYEIEKQFVNPDVLRLQQVADNTNAKVYYSNQADELIDFLIDEDSYKAVQKEVSKKAPLIDLMLLLVILAVSLSAEWFTRKYNGLL